MQDHAKIFSFAVTDTGKSDIIIGFNWLKQHNLEIDWQKQTMSSPGRHNVMCPGPASGAC
jgi:hypothetical protein